jgi:signal recognition particle subunit SRP68
MALLNGYDDVVSLANQEAKKLANLKAGPAVNAKKFQLVNVMGYAKYQKLKLVMERNEGMVNGIVKRKSKKKEVELKHLEEITHLYDALLQDARVIVSLPGGGSVDDFAGDTSPQEIEDEFLLEAKANILRLRSLRCYYLAKMHASPLVGKYSHAVALLDQTESLAREALEEIGACDQMEHRDELLTRLEKVVEEMKGEKCRVFAMSYLSKTGPSKSSLPLLARLHDYDIPANPTYVTDVPPKLEPIACKPSFFDVALNYVSEYPVEDLERVLELHGEKAGGTSGLLGWFRRG